MYALRDAAIGYAKAEHRIFPCRPGTKQPMVATGFKAANSNVSVVQDWWTKWPEANIGMAVPEGTLVVDVDPRNGGYVPTVLPNTRTARTPGGGLHLYYSVSEEMCFRSQWPDRSGVDIKAPGKGYVLLPPSVLPEHAEHEYMWLDQQEPVLLPTDVVKLLKRDDAPEFSAEIEAGPPKFLPWETGTRGGMAYLGTVLEAMREAENGTRNNTLFGITCRVLRLVRAGDLHEEKAMTQLRDTALAAGLSYEETSRTMLSAYGSKETT